MCVQLGKVWQRETLVDCVNGVSNGNGYNHSIHQRRPLLTPASVSMEPARHQVCFKSRLDLCHCMVLAGVQMRGVINFYEPANQ